MPIIYDSVLFLPTEKQLNAQMLLVALAVKNARSP